MSEPSLPAPPGSAFPGLTAAESEKMQTAFKDIAERSQKLLAEFAQRYSADGPQPADPLHLTRTFMDFTAKMLADPNKLLQAQMELWNQYLHLWQVTAQRLMGEKVEPVAEPAKGDRRFNDPAWKDEVVFDYLKQSYLLTARWLQSTVKEVEGVDDKTAQKVEFYTRQFIDAMSPSQLRSDQPAGREGHGREQGREPGEGPAEPSHRPRARQGQAGHPPDRHEGLQGGRERRHLARQGSLPERADAAHPVCAEHRRSACHAAADCAALDQQVLHPRPQAAELVHQVVRRPGLHCVRDLLGQSRPATDQAHLRRLHEAGTAGGAGRDPASDRRAPRVGDRLLHRRHADGGDPGLHGRARRRPDRGLHLLHRASRLYRTGRARRLHRRGPACGRRRGDEQEGLSRRHRDGDHLQHAARQRPHLVVRRQQLPDGQGPISLRSFVLERRCDAHAGGHAHVLPAQHVREEPAGQAGRADHRQCPDRPAQDHDPGLHAVRQGRPYRARQVGPTRQPSSSRARCASCWRARATLPAW